METKEATLEAMHEIMETLFSTVGLAKNPINIKKCPVYHSIISGHDTFYANSGQYSSGSNKNMSNIYLQLSLLISFIFCAKQSCVYIL